MYACTKRNFQGIIIRACGYVSVFCADVGLFVCRLFIAVGQLKEFMKKIKTVHLLNFMWVANVCALMSLRIS